MKAISHAVRLEGQHERGGCYAWLDSVDVLQGFGVGVHFYPGFHHIVIASKDGRTALIALPSKRWRQDLLDDGWDIKVEIEPGKSWKDMPVK